MKKTFVLMAAIAGLFLINNDASAQCRNGRCSVASFVSNGCVNGRCSSNSFVYSGCANGTCNQNVVVNQPQYFTSPVNGVNVYAPTVQSVQTYPVANVIQSVPTYTVTNPIQSVPTYTIPTVQSVPTYANPTPIQPVVPIFSPSTTGVDFPINWVKKMHIEESPSFNYLNN
jgi:hypothetical protein